MFEEKIPKNLCKIPRVQRKTSVVKKLSNTFRSFVAQLHKTVPHLNGSHHRTKEEHLIKNPGKEKVYILHPP